eukprot:gnl/TRDRNA2_/TRDRNA2_59991_c0_seq1.p1 gnl/TRDRNA2_/TRDRNA2_59991_c0~~gnl/TRDRNA2_/TRDRNA2_59991_c0_seq1.p1  ORF type:complete len:362 (-),score=65.50 gnl/TRDRNA2_/TRDRNA2_59991_c0_seq1:224-1177(-)
MAERVTSPLGAEFARYQPEVLPPAPPPAPAPFHGQGWVRPPEQVVPDPANIFQSKSIGRSIQAPPPAPLEASPLPTGKPRAGLTSEEPPPPPPSNRSLFANTKKKQEPKRELEDDMERHIASKVYFAPRPKETPQQHQQKQQQMMQMERMKRRQQMEKEIGKPYTVPHFVDNSKGGGVPGFDAPSPGPQMVAADGGPRNRNQMMAPDGYPQMFERGPSPMRDWGPPGPGIHGALGPFDSHGRPGRGPPMGPGWGGPPMGPPGPGWGGPHGKGMGKGMGMGMGPLGPPMGPRGPIGPFPGPMGPGMDGWGEPGYWDDW